MTNEPDGRPRDMQRAKLYRAEDRWSATDGFTGRRFTTVAEISDYVEAVLHSTYVQRHYGDDIPHDPVGYRTGRPLIDVRDGRGRRSACANPERFYIKVPCDYRTEAVVLHEVAHCLTHWRYGKRAAWHGHEFAAIFLDLVRNRMGRAAHDALRAQFDTKPGRVRYRRPRQLTDEQRARLAERLQRAHPLGQAARP